ncbi:Ribosomal RNA large subunit methyltransferase A [Streptococcus sp. DD10]|uniref:methyltransferase domain-containing protein n=1 Tax=Streptococcus sp. DD10 TaxID=1777878 RepID=UPI000793FC9A|nr:methyltransferase domain-containing protein [Streptococcus sp. DD10]KXT72827.1 Ribosomal RNA large subunit methyltransferase A [Streptococcus sp. DD10]
MNTLVKPKLQRFKTATAFICPICQLELGLVDSSLKCDNRHSFDIAKFGYVNLAPQMKQGKEYSKENFENRNLILEAGFYQHILEEVKQLLSENNQPTILDVGCGEGYYSRKLQEVFPDKSFYAFDISKHSIQLAAKNENKWRVNWFVGDLAHLPIKDHSIDIILDIFSPANYHEFSRILTEKGLIIKVIPTEHHLVEIRKLVQEQLSNKDYDNQAIIQHFRQNCQLISSKTLSKTCKLSSKEKTALLEMTPLLFHVNKNEINWEKLKQVTIEATILIGRVNDSLK